MNRHLTFVLAAAAALGGGGCTTYQTYPGPRRPATEVAVLSVPWTDLALDRQPVKADRVSHLEMLPGHHVVEWEFVFPNGYRERQRLDFVADAGTRYRLGQRFFPAPNPWGPVGSVIDLALDTALLPVSLLFPPQADERPDGAYYAWIVHGTPAELVAGVTPDLPLAHVPIAYVPLNGDGADAAAIAEGGLDRPD